MLKVPPEFPKMGVWFDLEVDDEFREGKDEITFALDTLNAAEKQVVKTFLMDVLANVRDPKELQLIWRAANSRTYIPDDRQLRVFLQEIVNRIG
ncbi:hypothetical protein [Terrarubrum flagellatum]|uniref:hypothetical protein n=1 Tax=Terrirubrum flagellatum TaxID=2895980 RepID=UPI0031455B4A